MHRRALGRVEHTKLSKGFVRRYAHFSAERVHFAHQMSFRRAADARIARKIADVVERNGKDNGLLPRASQRERRFDTRVPYSYHYRVIIKVFCVEFYHTILLCEYAHMTE